VKVYSLNSSSSVPAPVKPMLGLVQFNQQAEVFVSAASKAEAFRLLAARHMEPGSIRDPEFQLADGNDVRVLTNCGLFAAPAVIATNRLTGDQADVVRVEVTGEGTLLGRLERHGPNKSELRFVPTPAGVAGAVWTEPVTLPQVVAAAAELYRVNHDTVDMLVRDEVPDDAWNEQAGTVAPHAVGPLIQRVGDHLEQLDMVAESVVDAAKENVALVKRLNDQLTEARLARGRLAGDAIRLGITTQVAQALGVGESRLYQMQDATRVEEARRIRQRHTGNRR